MAHPTTSHCWLNPVFASFDGGVLCSDVLVTQKSIIISQISVNNQAVLIACCDSLIKLRSTYHSETKLVHSCGQDISPHAAAIDITLVKHPDPDPKISVPFSFCGIVCWASGLLHIRLVASSCAKKHGNNTRGMVCNWSFSTSNGIEGLGRLIAESLPERRRVFQCIAQRHARPVNDALKFVRPIDERAGLGGVGPVRKKVDADRGVAIAAGDGVKRAQGTPEGTQATPR
mmetsp:Transcript_25497/g.52153  ORF Transcript_25497/g.52153 Transcript_25497/m.52153 type:complete len:230 (+) Transcript_25497:366-1055(+)